MMIEECSFLSETRTRNFNFHSRDVSLLAFNSRYSDSYEVETGSILISGLKQLLREKKREFQFILMMRLRASFSFLGLKLKGFLVSRKHDGKAFARHLQRRDRSVKS